MGQSPRPLPLLLHSPSNITKQLTSSRERPSRLGGARIQGYKAWHPLAVSGKAWRAPLFQVSFGLAGFVLCPDGLVVRDLGYY